MIKYCQYCGAEYEVLGREQNRQKYCCAQCRIRAKHHRPNTHFEYGYSESVKSKHLRRVAAAADREGISYGEYQARKYLSSIPKININIGDSNANTNA